MTIAVDLGRKATIQTNKQTINGEGEKSEGETSIFGVLTVKTCCQYTGCSFETDWVNIILAVI